MSALSDAVADERRPVSARLLRRAGDVGGRKREQQHVSWGHAEFVSSSGGDGLEGVKPTHEIRTSRAGSCTRPADGVSISCVSEVARHSPEHSLSEQRRAPVRPVRALNDSCSSNDRQAGDRQEVCEAVRPLAREPGEEVDEDRREAAGCKSRVQISPDRD